MEAGERSGGATARRSAAEGSRRRRPRLIANPIRQADFGQKLEYFFLAAVTTVLVIRTQLWLTNYPQLGGNGLHIAHLLYGGIFMVVSIWLFVIYLNRSARAPGAVIGGVGFGFFIDELGKFITSDNNYFFKPAAALIYLIFVTLFLIIRELGRRERDTPEGALANALALLPGLANGELREPDRREALDLLDRAGGADDELRARVRALLADAEVAAARPPSRATRLAARMRGRVTALTQHRRFPAAVITTVVAWAVLSALGMVELQFTSGGGARPGFIEDNLAHFDFMNWGSFLSALASVVLVAVGVVRMRRDDRLGAYHVFSWALLVSILVNRTFSFVESQFGAVFGLAVDLVLYASISALADRERERLEAERRGPWENRLDGEAKEAAPAA